MTELGISQRRRQCSVRETAVLIQLGILVSCAAIWQWAPEDILDDTLVSRPTLIASQIAEWLRHGVLEQQAMATLTSVCLGLLFGAAAGTALGFVTGVLRGIDRFLEPPVTFLFALPKSAFVPLFILWFGIGTEQHVLFCASVAFFFFFFAALNGIRSTPLALETLFDIVGSSRLKRARLLYLPSCFSWMLTGLRLAIPHTFVASITTEVIASRSGLGNLVKTSSASMDPAGTFAALTTLLILSLSLMWVATVLVSTAKWRFTA